ncbi:MAG: disulfide bond formation protein B [Pikeienuella sp.]
MTSSSIFGYKTFGAWVIALTATLGALFIGDVLGKEPCSLCWYQRTFMFPIAIILSLGLWWDDRTVNHYALVLAFPGALIAIWHLGLYWDIIPKPAVPCSATGPSCSGADQVIFGIPIAMMSLVAFVLIAVLCALSTREKK